MILEPKKIKSLTVSIVSSSICYEVKVTLFRNRVFADTVKLDEVIVVV